VWGRRPGAPAALAHLAPIGAQAAIARGSRAGGPLRAQGLPVQCSRIADLARLAKAHSARLIGASPPQIVSVDLKRARHPSWRTSRLGLLMTRPGRLQATFTIPRAGPWDLWLQGEIMPPIGVSVDGRPLASISGQLTGVATDPDTMTPLRIRLAAGPHRVTITRGKSNRLAPGSGGSAILDSIFLTPVGPRARATLHVTSAARWRSLCGRPLEWVEAVPR
jgi:hypothetical protein